MAVSTIAERRAVYDQTVDRSQNVKGQTTMANSQSIVPASDSPTFPTRMADGGSTALGSTADPAYSGDGAASLIAINKAIVKSLLAPTPAGTNAIGTVTAVGNVASGAN